MNAKPRPRSRKLIEAALMLAIVVVIALIVVRVVRFAGTGEAVSAMGVDYSEPNLRGLRVRVPGRPHFIPDYIEAPESIGRWVTFSLDTNSRGLRGPEFEDPKPDGTYRVICAGECVTFGIGVEGKQTYPHILGKLLDRTYPDRGVEVLNGGKPASHDQIADRVEQEFVHYSPDLVVFGPGANTVFLPSHVGFGPTRVELSEEEYAQEMLSFRGSVTRVVDLARSHGFELVFVTPTVNSFFYPDGLRWSDELVSIGEEFGVPTVDTSELFGRVERERGLVLETVQGNQRLVGGDGGEGRVLLEVPFDDAGNTRYVMPEIYAYLDEHPRVAPALSIDENHPNPDGHALIAEAIHDAIVDTGWLGSAGR